MVRKHLVELSQLAIDNCDGDYVALILFGSHARGDATLSSDIDILQVVNARKPSYRKCQLCYSVYTPNQLYAMAKHGSLFALHVVREAKEIDDVHGILKRVRDKFEPPASYASLQEDVRHASRLLDVNVTTYNQYWQGFHSLMSYLLRTFLYSKIYDQGRITFSMTEVVEYFEDVAINDVLAIRYADGPNYDSFSDALSVLNGYLNGKQINPYQSIEALIINDWHKSRFTFIHGLRLLNGPGNIIPYDD